MISSQCCDLENTEIQGLCLDDRDQKGLCLGSRRLCQGQISSPSFIDNPSRYHFTKHFDFQLACLHPRNMFTVSSIILLTSSVPRAQPLADKYMICNAVTSPARHLYLPTSGPSNRAAPPCSLCRAHGRGARRGSRHPTHL